MATCMDVAKCANVSTATVSRALRKRGQNSLSETYQRVIQIADELNYFPNPSASSLRTNSTRTVGLLIPNINNPFYIRLASLLEQALRAKGCRLSISFCSNGYEKDERSILQMMLDYRFSGIIFSPRNRKNSDIVNLCKQNNITMMQLLTKSYDDSDAIVMDDTYGMYIGTKHLLKKGHVKILFAGNHERMEGVNRAYDESGIPRDNATIYEYGLHDTIENTSANLEKILIDHRPSAAFAVTDFVGVAMYRAMKKLHLQFPEDISFLLYDDQTWSAMMDVSVITHPLDMIADMASHRLIKAIESKMAASPAITMIRPYLLERNSIQMK